MTKTKLVFIAQALNKLMGLKDDTVPEMDVKTLEALIMVRCDAAMKQPKQEEKPKAPMGAALMLNTVKIITKEDDTEEFLANLCWQLKVEKHPDHIRMWYVKDVYSNEEWHTKCYFHLGEIARRFVALGYKARFDKSGFLAIKK